MSEANATVNTIGTVAQNSVEVIDAVSNDMHLWIQPWLNKLYYGQYREFFSITIFGVPLANLIAAFMALFFFLFLRKIFTTMVLTVLSRLSRKTKTTIDDMIVTELGGPIRFVFVLLGIRVFLQLMFISSELVREILDAAFIYFLFWVLYAMTPATKELLHAYSERNRHLSYELSNFMIRILRLLIAFLGLIAILYSFGINVTAFFASLGIGGLALALAAKDTAANLFGSLALLIDHSIKIGEWIKVHGIEGTVESIGMRTTKIRTFEKSIIAIPNSIVANSHIENYSRRAMRRIRINIGLTYDTTEEQMQNIVSDIEDMLRHHQRISQSQTLFVKFTDFNASDLGILVYCFADTAEWVEYLEIHQDVNLRIMDIVQRHGGSFAFPSQSLYIESMPKTQTTEVP